MFESQLRTSSNPLMDRLRYLPAYYAILNLMKVGVLLGPRHADLPKNRTHGASYNPEGKDSRSILTEEI
jgi:hypothetical protein